jgi:hypothetical protein
MAGPAVVVPKFPRLNAPVFTMGSTAPDAERDHAVAGECVGSCHHDQSEEPAERALDDGREVDPE